MSSGAFWSLFVGAKFVRNITKVLKSATGVLFGRVTSGTGRGEELTPSQVRSLLSVYTVTQTDTAISTAVNNLIGGSPGLLDTLDELAAALGDDANFASTVTTSLAGKQATLVSGTNIKTINSTSLLGSGDIVVSASPAGSSGQVQYNNAGAFGGMTAVVYAATVTHVTVTSQAAATVPLCVKGAASQSGNLFEARNSASTLLCSVDASGNIQMPLSATTYIGSLGANVTCSHSSFVSVCRSGDCYGTQFVGGANQGSYYLRNDVTAAGFGWGAYGTTSIGSPDTKISRNAAGVVEINNGTFGTFRDLIVRNFRMSAPTLVPASASATGSEGQIAWDANYIYVCTATNTWKRVAIATW